jgi:hypothetical protein
VATKRRPIARRRARRINQEAIEAWKACDYTRLQQALGLHPAHCSPLPLEVTALGVSQDLEPQGKGIRNNSLLAAQDLQRELLELAGWPDCRAAYEENLKDAQEMAAHYRELVRHPDRGGISFADPARQAAERKRDLEKALEDVAWRQALLDELEEAKQ